VAELTAEGFDAAASPGTRGQFDVVADGRLVFSKYEVHRFPENGEILTALRE
jgi:selT/selW/selH-like putative selenoprotein